MTTEIAIMNHNGIALAADSAVTIGDKKVWQHANKLFSLSPYNDIGIMIYGNGDFISFPWETIIKSYRKSIGKRTFKTLNECSNTFIDFLNSDKISNKAHEGYSVFRILDDCITRIHAEVSQGHNIEDLLIHYLSQISAEALLFQYNKQDFINTFSEYIIIYADEKFEKKLSKDITIKLTTLCYSICCSKWESNSSTGVVIAGFGSDEFFPVLEVYVVDGKYNGYTRCWLDETKSHNLNIEEAGATIVPFAQSDMIDLCMRGIAFEHIRFFANYLSDTTSKILTLMNNNDAVNHAITDDNIQIITQSVVDKFSDDLKLFIHDTFIKQIINVVATLPKEEMAAMAEALVEITSLRRKVDSNLQSVGGPTDVAIISKGDGFIWCKRKHYFDISLNQDFGMRKHLFINGGEHETNT